MTDQITTSQESTYKSCTHPINDSVGQASLRPTLGIDIKPLNFGQVSEEKQQVTTVRPIFNILQQMAGIGILVPGNKKPGGIRATIWHNGGSNGPLTLADDQRGGIKILTAMRIKEKVMQPTGNEVLQDMFVFDNQVDNVNMNQMRVFINKSPQELLI